MPDKTLEELKKTDFSKHPKSITQLRSSRTNDARDATPRDNLIEMLQDIDAGRCDPDAMVIIWREKTKDNFSNAHMVAAPDHHVTVGMVQIFLHRYLAK